MILKKHFVNLLATTVLSNCGHFQVSDVGPFVQLPGSKKCFQYFTLSGREKEYPPEVCAKMMERAVHIDSETWAVLRRDIQINCQLNECKQITGAGDALFLLLDRYLQKVPLKLTE